MTDINLGKTASLNTQLAHLLPEVLAADAELRRGFGDVAALGRSDVIGQGTRRIAAQGLPAAHLTECPDCRTPC